MSKAPFDWMDPRRNPDRGKIEKARREAMYRGELEERAALLQRLGYDKDRARARLAANLAWDFRDGTTPARRRRRWMRSSTELFNGTSDAQEPPPRAVKEERDDENRDLAGALLMVATRRDDRAPACGVDEQVHNAALKDRDAQKQKLAETQAALDKEKAAHKADVDARDARVVVLTKKLESLGQDVSRLETERGNLGGELEQAQKRMEELRKAQAQAEARAAQFRKLVTQFKSLTDAGKLQVEIRENRMIVRLGDKILFDPGKTDLKPEGKDALTQVTAVLKALPNRNFQIAGHTDNVPIKSAKFRSNWDLSTARAVEVLNFMVARRHGGQARARPPATPTVAGRRQRLAREQGEEPAHRDHAGPEPGRPAADRRGAQGEQGRRRRRHAVALLLVEKAAHLRRVARACDM